MASYDRFILRVKGKGCHGSAPKRAWTQLSWRPILFSPLKNITKRSCATSPAVVTGMINAGFAFNVIPNELLLKELPERLMKVCANILPNVLRR